MDLLLPLALELPKPLLPMPMLLSVSPLLALVPPVNYIEGGAAGDMAFIQTKSTDSETIAAYSFAVESAPKHSATGARSK